MATQKRRESLRTSPINIGKDCWAYEGTNGLSVFCDAESLIKKTSRPSVGTIKLSTIRAFLRRIDKTKRRT